MYNLDPLNIMYYYARATDEQRERGARWYSDALDKAHSIARDTNLLPDVVARVVAVLSPQVRWERNIAWAREVCEAFAEGRALPQYGLGNSLRRARLALSGDTEDVERDQSPKVRDFYRSIIGWVASPCIDRHATTVALGGAPRSSLTLAQYRRVAEAYRTAARELGVSPRSLQATTWLVEVER